LQAQRLLLVRRQPQPRRHHESEIRSDRRCARPSRGGVRAEFQHAGLGGFFVERRFDQLVWQLAALRLALRHGEGRLPEGRSDEGLGVELEHQPERFVVLQHRFELGAQLELHAGLDGLLEREQRDAVGYRQLVEQRARFDFVGVDQQVAVSFAVARLRPVWDNAFCM